MQIALEIPVTVTATGPTRWKNKDIFKKNV